MKAKNASKAGGAHRQEAAGASSRKALPVPPGSSAWSAWGTDRTNHGAEGLTNRALAMKNGAVSALYEASDLFARAGENQQAEDCAQLARQASVPADSGRRLAGRSD